MASDVERQLTRSERYRAASRWHAATSHIFLDRWARGSLPQAAFSRYIVQDYLYVQALVPLVGQLYGQAPNFPARRRFRDFLVALLTDEDRYFMDVLQELGVDDARAHAPVPHPLTAAFVSYLVSASRRDNYGPLLSLLVASEWVYEEWGLALRRAPPKTPVYRRWVELHSSEAFTAFVREIREELDALCLTPDEENRALTHFVAVVDFEARFWDMAWSGSG
jgi:thiaminase/transcriptional activator TenA